MYYYILSFFHYLAWCSITCVAHQVRCAQGLSDGRAFLFDTAHRSPHLPQSLWLPGAMVSMDISSINEILAVLDTPSSRLVATIHYKVPHWDQSHAR
jgi:hypothetical protein